MGASNKGKGPSDIFPILTIDYLTDNFAAYIAAATQAQKVKLQK
jgi:hypothetical protein